MGNSKYKCEKLSTKNVSPPNIINVSQVFKRNSPNSVSVSRSAKRENSDDTFFFTNINIDVLHTPLPQITCLVFSGNERNKSDWHCQHCERFLTVVNFHTTEFLPPGYVIRREGNVFTAVCLSVSGHTGTGVPQSLVAGPFSSLCFQVLYGGGVLQPLVPGLQNWGWYPSQGLQPWSGLGYLSPGQCGGTPWSGLEYPPLLQPGLGCTSSSQNWSTPLIRTGYTTGGTPAVVFRSTFLSSNKMSQRIFASYLSKNPFVHSSYTMNWSQKKSDQIGSFHSISFSHRGSQHNGIAHVESACITYVCRIC